MSTNGKLRSDQLTTVDGWAELTPATARAYLAAAAFILLHYGIRPQITRPYGAYRSLSMQRVVKAIYGRLAATPGYSNHGLGIAFDMDNVMAIARAVGGLVELDSIMARFGFDRNAGNGSGGIEEWHYGLVAIVDLAGVAGMDPTEIDPIKPPEDEIEDNMAIQITVNDSEQKYAPTPAQYFALVGDGIPWAPYTDARRANNFAAYVKRPVAIPCTYADWEYYMKLAGGTNPIA
jgi:hypothetical protein